jgi:hypothetical protein
VLPQLPESDKREGAALLRRMVLLSLPSLIGPGLFWLLFAIPSDGKIAAALERIPHNIFVLVMGVVIVALFAQFVTLPMAAFTLFQVLLRGPAEIGRQPLRFFASVLLHSMQALDGCFPALPVGLCDLRLRKSLDGQAKPSTGDDQQRHSALANFIGRRERSLALLQSGST